jgi:hypothetical protein
MAFQTNRKYNSAILLELMKFPIRRKATNTTMYWGIFGQHWQQLKINISQDGNIIP